jgi:hypothetical protein
MGGKGGSDGTNSTVTSTTTDLPEWVKPYQMALLDRAEYQSAVPYETYNGPRVADFSPYEQEAMARMGEAAMGGDSAGLTEAARLAYNVGNDSFGDVNTDVWSGYEAGRGNDSDMLQSYMSPYMQNVVDIEKREAMRDADIRHRDTGLDAARAGSLGGYREGIMRSETERDLGQRLDDLQAQGQQASFADARQAFGVDQQNQQAAAGMGLQAQQGNQQTQLGLQQNQLGYQQNQLRSADQLAGYGTQQFADEMERLGIMQGIGAQQRQLVQQGLDTGYQDFMRQQSMPWESINMLNTVIHGGSIAPGTTSNMFGPQPSNTQNLLGSGIAAAGMYGQGKGGS